MKHTLKVGAVGIVAGKPFILIFEKSVIFIKVQFPFSIFRTLFELYADTVSLVGDAGFPGVDGYAPVTKGAIFSINSNTNGIKQKEIINETKVYLLVLLL